ncbi:hypothetical protein [Nocardia sp. NPDC049149]|uniref:hypothetical protein n=1 Tax=Nocardia sp. NPDC049149 TaxID=3364315 RepID=UPI00371D6CC5
MLSEVHNENVETTLLASAQTYGRTSMQTKAERADLWPRLRNVLLVAGDVLGVVVLIVVVALIGTHGTSLDFLTAMIGR